MSVVHHGTKKRINIASLLRKSLLYNVVSRLSYSIASSAPVIQSSLYGWWVVFWVWPIFLAVYGCC